MEDVLRRRINGHPAYGLDQLLPHNWKPASDSSAWTYPVRLCGLRKARPAGVVHRSPFASKRHTYPIFNGHSCSVMMPEW